MKQYLTMGAIALAVSIAVTAAMSFFKPQPRLAKVDLMAIFTEQKDALAKNIRPGMSPDEQKALLDEATMQMERVDAAMAQLVKDCDCAVLNSAAIARTPLSGAGVPDLTDKLRLILAKDGQ